MNHAVAAPTKSQVGIAMFVFGLLMAEQVAGKATRDGIFLSQFNSSALPVMVAVAASSGLILSILQARTLVRFGPFRIITVSLITSAGLHAIEFVLLGQYPRITACAIYVHAVAFGSIVLSGFWSVMNESFDARAAKNVFSRIGGCGTLGGLCGGVMAERVTAWFSPSEVVLVLSSLHLCGAALLWRRFSPIAPSTDVASRPPETTALSAVQRYPFLVKIAALVLAASVGASLLDFVFKAHAAQSLGRGPSLVRFFGLYYTSTSLLIFLAQALMTQFVLKHAGLARSAAVLPGMTAVGSLTAIFLPGFSGLTAIRGTEAVLRGSIFRSAYELFYTAVAPAEKRAVKPLIDVGLERLGDALGAGAVGLLLAVAPWNYGAILLGAGGCSIVAFVTALRLQGGYVRALESSLRHRAIEIDPTVVQTPVTRSFLMRSIEMQVNPLIPALADAPPRQDRPTSTKDPYVRRALELRSGDVDRVTRELDHLRLEDWTLAPLAIELLAWDEVMPAARSALVRMGPRIAGTLVDALLDVDRDFSIRRRTPRVLAGLRSKRSVDGLYAALQDQRFEVRFYSSRALYILVSDHSELALPPGQIWDAVNREIHLQQSKRQSLRLLDGRESLSKEWFFDDQLRDRADRKLEHLFTLLALLLPVDAVRIAFRALHTDDRQLKAMAFEYLESATPARTRHLLLALLEADTNQHDSPELNDALARLMKTEVKINQSLRTAMKSIEIRP